MRVFLVTVFGCLLSVSAGSANAADYVRQKWFDVPSPLVAPRVTAKCVKTASAHVPCPTWQKPLRQCLKSTCIGHAYTTDVERTSAIFIVSGPDSPSEAVKRAVEGVASLCAYKAIASGKKAAAATPSPEPSARVGAALATTVGIFKLCISKVTAGAVVAGIARQLSIRIDTPKHWARL